MDQRLLIAQLNIEHYRRSLEGDLDDAKRRLIEELLAEEEARLASVRASIAEGVLGNILDFLAQRAIVVFEVEDITNRQSQTGADLSAVFAEMPCAIGLQDAAGKIVLANDAMRRFVSETIPSRDPHRLLKWRVYGADGETLGPVRWPGARALRGERVNPGLAAIHTSDDSHETPLRVAAVPVMKSDGSVRGAIAVAYQTAVLGQQKTHDLLEEIFIDEQLRAWRHGWRGGPR